MSLLDELKKISRRLDYFGKANRVADLIASYDRLRNPPKGEGLSRRRRATTIMRQCVEAAVSEAGYAVPRRETTDAVKRLNASLAEIIEDCKDDMDRILNQPGDRWQSLSDGSRDLCQALQFGWTKARPGKQGESVPSIYDVLDQAAHFPHADLQRIRKIDEALAELLTELPPESVANLREAAELKRERDRLLQNIKNAVPDQIRDLVEKIGSGTATLDDLTVENLSWLSREKMASQFQVRFLPREEP
jgi:molecular chaperone GrpE (heat shock protein)